MIYALITECLPLLGVHSLSPVCAGRIVVILATYYLCHSSLQLSNILTLLYNICEIHLTAEPHVIEMAFLLIVISN
jgi:hypothetical protein